MWIVRSLMGACFPCPCEDQVPIDAAPKGARHGLDSRDAKGVTP
jgi:hypothetical protein